MVIVGILLVATGILGAGVSGLASRAAASQQRRYAAAELGEEVRAVDGVEWRVAAGAEDLDHARAQLSALKYRLHALLEETSEVKAAVGPSVSAYLAAVEAELGAYRLGEAGKAQTIDENQVDPAFERVLEDADTFAAHEARSAARTLRAVRLLAWVAAVAAVAVLGAGSWVVFAARGKARLRAVVFASDRRFRSLVESSTDVITVVSNDGRLRVMSPTLGALEAFCATPEPTSIEALLPATCIDEWRDADRHLQETAVAQRLELVLTGDDLGRTVFEARGTTLVGSAGDRVWTWRDVSDRKNLEHELSHRAFHDGLTGLPNRALFEDRTDHALARSARNAQPVTVMFCDFDNFKSINDTLGHAAGDEYLRIVAKRLEECLRPGDTIARFGGDEFVVLLEDVSSQEALSLARRMNLTVAHEVCLRDHILLPAVSIGIATAVLGSNTDELLRNADTALYAAKRAGKGRAEVYEPEMRQSSCDLLEYQADLSQALRNGELSLHYQPTVCLATGEIEGVEALVRWNHPLRGSVSPATFVPIAEATGLIVSIGRWILEQACQDVRRLQDDGRPPLCAHVNISPRQLHDPTIVAHVAEVLAATDLPPELLVIEVTEGMLLDDHRAVERLHELRALGVRIAIDDFGTGYTSISYLQHLPVDIVKIDRSFVSGNALEPKERGAFLGAIISLARSLGLRTVAEGIETDEHVEELRRMGCEAGQGFLWSAAAPSHELGAALDRLATVGSSTRRTAALAS